MANMMNENSGNRGPAPRSRSQGKRRGPNSENPNNINNNNNNNNNNNPNNNHEQQLRPLPLQTLQTSDLSLRDQDRPRVRSISPHARAILRRTFSRSRSRSRARPGGNDSNDNDNGYNNGNDNDDDCSSVFSASSSASSASRGSVRSNSSRSNSRSRSSSRSSSNTPNGSTSGSSHKPKQMLVAVTSCRSEGYYSQKAPGAISMLPRKAPSALKTFHELAVGMKDAYEAVGATPSPMDARSEEAMRMSKGEREGRTILWDFVKNINFLLRLVDEIATDSATRGALKDDASFKGLRDVIKKCNKVLERMLVRRESKYTLFYRLVQPHDAKDIGKMQLWNHRVEKTVSNLPSSGSTSGSASASSNTHDSASEAGSVVSDTSQESSGSASTGGLFRGRSTKSVGSGVSSRSRTRRATPTPRMRHLHRFRKNSSSNLQNSQQSDSGADGYSTVTTANVSKTSQNGHGKGEEENSNMSMPGQGQFNGGNVTGTGNGTGAIPNENPNAVMTPKDELVGMIRELRSENQNAAAASTPSQPEDLKPNWMPKADIPGAVPLLPVEYIHRHRLMKQVVNSLINRPGAIENNTSSSGGAGKDDKPKQHHITCITSRHADKAGNGKTTLAAAGIQTVEVRERFGGGIAWIQVGRAPLTELDVRRLYEELYDQIIMRDITLALKANNENDPSTEKSNDIIAEVLMKSRRKFQGCDLDGMKEDLGRMLSRKNVLICLDDVWRAEDVRRFIFQTNAIGTNIPEPCHYRLLVTTRTPGLMGANGANEVYVRIFSEQEAVKLLLFSAGRRLYGGKNSQVFEEARHIVRGCGNSPLALRLAGGMLRTSNRNWTLSSPTWRALSQQCKVNLNEASKIRSFVNSVGRIVDLSFVTVVDLGLRASLRRCFVTFAVVFHDNELLLTGRGIPRGIVRKLFVNVISGMEFETNTDVVSADTIMDTLESMNMLQRAGHDAHFEPSSSQSDAVSAKTDSTSSQSKTLTNGSIDDSNSNPFDENESDSIVEIPHIKSYLMHESIKHIASEMAKRTSSSFAPKADIFTSFRAALESEMEQETTVQSSSWFSSAAKYLFSTQSDHTGTSKTQFHELMVCALTKSEDTEVEESQPYDKENVEKYIVAYLPTHLTRAKMYSKASALLLDRTFIKRRVEAIGSLEASQQHMLDLIDLRKNHHRTGNTLKSVVSKSNLDDQSSTSTGLKSPDSTISGGQQHDAIDAGKAVREGSRRILEAVRMAASDVSNGGQSIDIAVCLSTAGEGLLKARQTKESIIRLEEAVLMFQALLGSFHVEVAKSLNTLAKAYLKSGDEQVAIAKLSEAGRIYESCNANRHYNSIANVQLMASLLVNSGDWERATAKYDRVIAMKIALYGQNSLQVAKALNDYAIILAKHSRMSEALRQYDAARLVFGSLKPPDSHDVENFAFEITLIDLNIASIKSKLSNYKGALESYERGVEGLRVHTQKEENGTEPVDVNRLAAQKRHLVSAIGRIGSLRMKLKDNAGALKAYLMLLEEVDKDSPLASRMEKAKAHVKCATIYRQIGSADNNNRAVTHLQEALEMYTELHGSNHKDTKAISSSLKQWTKADK